VDGNATLYAGSRVETDRASSRLRLGAGRVEMAPASRVRVAEKGIILEQGSTDVTGMEAVASWLRIAPEAGSTAKITLAAPNVLVAAAKGPVRVFHRSGDLIAFVEAGAALSLTPSAQQSDTASLTGCVTKVEGRYLLKDVNTNVTVELRGGNLDQFVGRRIEMTGAVFRTAQPAPGATQVIRVTDAKAVSGECGAQPAAGQPAQQPPAQPKAPRVEGRPSGISGTTVAVIVAGGAGGAGAALAASRGSKSR